MDTVRNYFSITIIFAFLGALGLYASVDASANCSIDSTEYSALYALYNSTNGNAWAWRKSGATVWNFDGSSDPCLDHWQGLSCNCNIESPIAHVKNITLSQYNLNGTLPYSIGAFSHALFVDLSDNHLTAAIPNSIGSLERVTTILMNGNQLNGTIPASIGNLKHLVKFVVKQNFLSGEIPATMGGLSNLTTCDFYNNAFTGTFPSFIGNLSKLQYLDVYQNKLHGTIPEFLGSLHDLNYLYVGFNQFTGTLPENIGTLEKLISFYANTNHLHGTIPQSFATLSKLQYLFLYQNDFEGSLKGRFNPTVQGSLKHIVLHDNRLTGQLPDELFAISSLLLVDLSSNCFHGSLPATLCLSANLETLALDGMCAAAACRTELFPGLVSTYRLKRILSGGIPSCLFKLPKLTTLHMSGNGLSGVVPSNLSSSMSGVLTNLGLSHNFLRGNLPGSFQRRQWENLDFTFNRLDGMLSEQFVEQTVNGTLDLSNNRISGPIPRTILSSTGKINILDGNLFQCKYDKSDLPERDQKKTTYQCGSNSFNLSYYVWLSISGTLILVAVVVTYRKKGDELTPRRALLMTISVLRSKLEIASLPGADGVPIGRDLRLYHWVCGVGRLYLRLACCVTAFIVVVFLTLYAILAVTSSTMTRQYAYTLSFIYVTGSVTSGVAMTFFILFTVFAFVCFGLLLRLFRREYATFEKSVLPQPAADADEEEGEAAVSESEPTPNADVQVEGGTRSKKEEAREAKFTWEKVSVVAALVSVDLIVVVGANVLFVYVLLYSKGLWVSAAQITLSVFKVAWSVLSSWAITYIAVNGRFRSKNIPKIVFSLLWIFTLFNNIVVPCLVVMAASSSCFYNAVVQGNSIKSSYEYQECTSYTAGECVAYDTIPNESSFQPPFIYNYQCAASILTAYAPSFVYLCIISGFLIPAAKFTAYKVVRWARPDSGIHFLLAFLPSVLKPVPPGESLLLSRMPIFDARRLLVNLINYLGVLMTFGAMFPPLAVAVTATIISVVYVARQEVKHFLLALPPAQRTLYARKIDADCINVGSDTMLLRSMRALLLLSYCFYALFLFDPLGDAVGFGRALWVLIVMPIFPFVLDLIFRCYSGTLCVRRRLHAAESVLEASQMVLELRVKMRLEDTESPMMKAEPN